MAQEHIDRAVEIIKKFESFITSDDYPGEARDCAEYHVQSLLNVLETPSETYKFYLDVQEAMKTIV